MILVAFVLVLVATVMLIIGTFFDAGVAYIWISIAACVATFGVLAASYLARRRDGEQPTARPQPLSGEGSRSAAVQSAPRGSTLGGGGTATAQRTSTTTETDEDVQAERDEPSVTIVAARSDEGGPETDPVDKGLGTDDAAEMPQDAPAPAPRAVTPHRVVRRAAPAASEASAPSSVQDAPDEPAAAAGSDDDQHESAQPQPTRVVRRRPAASGTTRKVVRRAQPGGTAAAAGTRQVVRRAASAGGGQTRTVRRVVRRADDATPTASPARTATPAPAAKASSSNRGGTRGKRAREVLSQVKGVGPAKQDALLKKFGSLEDMVDASIEDLTSVKGVGEAVAKELKQTLKDR